MYTSRFLLLALLSINIIDIIIHVVADRIEPIRVTASILIIAAAIFVLLKASQHSSRYHIAISAAAYAWLNGWFVYISGIGGVGLGLIISTLALSMGFVLLLTVNQVDR